MTTLRIQSAGAQYAPVLIDNGWQLVNTNGNVLCGYRGKIYEFESQAKANTWLSTNLSRVKNSKKDGSDARMQQIARIYLETGEAFALQEVHNIYDLNAGIWDAVELAASP